MALSIMRSVFIGILISQVFLMSCEVPHCPVPIADTTIQNNKTNSTGTQITQWQLKTNSNISGDFISVDFADSTTGFIVGVNGVIVKTSDGGKTFDSLNSGTTQSLYGVHCINAQTVIIVGNGGIILRSVNGGQSWSSIPSGTTNGLRTIYFNNSSLGYITGGTGTFLKTTDGGLSWSTINLGTTDGLYGIFFTDINTGYLSGLNGTILKTTDGWNSWSNQVSGLGAGPTILHSIYFTDANNGIIVGGIGNPSFTPNPVILRTTDGGSNWTFLNSPTPNDSYAEVRFIDSKTGFIAGGDIINNTGTILKTTDGGSTWNPISISSKRLNDLKIINSGDGFAVGMNTTIIQGI